MSAEHLDKIREYVDPVAIGEELADAIPAATLDRSVDVVAHNRVAFVCNEIDTALGGVVRARELAEIVTRKRAKVAEPLVPKTPKEFLATTGEEPFSLSFYGTEPNQNWLKENTSDLAERYGSTVTYSRAFNEFHRLADRVTPPLHDSDDPESALWRVVHDEEGRVTQMVVANRRHFFEWAFRREGSKNLGPGLAHAALNLAEIQAGNI